MKRLTAIASIFVASCGVVHAQSAEDTVAYILLSLEDGATNIYGSTHLTWKKTANGAFTLRTERGNGTNVATIAIERKSDCIYLISGMVVFSTDRVSSIATVDFHKISLLEYSRGDPAMPSSITSEPGAICYEIKEHREKGLVGRKICPTETKTPFPISNTGITAATSGNERRHQSAVSFFKQKYCAMRAF